MIGRCEADHEDGKPCLAPLTKGRTCPRPELHAKSEEQRYTEALTAAGWAVPVDSIRTLVALYVRLMDGKPEPGSPATDTTIDGVPVTIGMKVWDYDLRPVTVIEVEHLDPHTGAWWYRCTRRPDGDGPGHMFDAKRMWFRPPQHRKDSTMTDQLTRPDEPARAVETYRKFLTEEVFDYAEVLTRYEQDCADDRARGYRPHYCVHGTNQWVDYDNICQGCEDSLTVWDMAEASAWERHTRYLHVLDQFSTLSRSHERIPVPTYVTDAYVQWLMEVSPTPVSPATTEEN